MAILPLQGIALRSMPDSPIVTNCFTPPAGFRRLALVRITHRSHEHRALHGVSRAWHAAGHTAVVAGAVVAELTLTPDFRSGVLT